MVANFHCSHDIFDEEWFFFTTTRSSLLDLWKKNQDLFYVHVEEPPSGFLLRILWSLWRKSKRRPWWTYGERGEKEGQRQRIALRISPRWEHQLWEGPRNGEFVLSARDLIEGMVTYYRQTGRRFQSDYLHTSDFSGDRRIAVGYFRGLIDVEAFWPSQEYYPTDAMAVARSIA